ncbi:uncharacterized protein [Haliotis cracherodii]|uniref:uncharacterized protein n=1 Tax=Haliotis cracherodii TaxID=6455 RepID=UPI0039E7DAA2
MNYREWSSATPKARRTAIRKMKEAGLVEKRRLEKEGLLPDYDYPDPKGTQRSSGQKRWPITVLNDNPGPCYSIYPPRSIGVPLCGRGHARSQVMLVDGEDLINDNDVGKVSPLPVDTVARRREGRKEANQERDRKESVYQSTHNAQALTEKKLKPEFRVKLQTRKLYPEYAYYKCDGPIHSITARQGPSYIPESRSPGPKYDTRDSTRSPAFSFGIRHHPRCLRVSDAGVLVHQ